MTPPISAPATGSPIEMFALLLIGERAMKIIIAAMMLLMFGQQASAEITKASDVYEDGMGYTYTLCIDGYKFVIHSAGTLDGGVAITQFYKRNHHNLNSPIPAKCSN